MCCASRHLSGELANMKRQLAALQASLAAMDPELMALLLCAGDGQRVTVIEEQGN